MPKASLHGFTLIELLVVVTIIVALLALLAPALDRAIYQAELLQCMTQQRGIGQGLNQYAFENRRSHVYRSRVQARVHSKPEQLQYGGDAASNYRALIAPYISINGHFNDPLHPAEFDYEKNTTDFITGSYAVYAGWFFIGNGGMTKVGKSISFDSRKFDVLVADWEAYNQATIASETTHQDRAGRLAPNITTQFVRWQGNNRGDLDRSFVFSDLSAQQFRSINRAYEDQPSQFIMLPFDNASAVGSGWVSFLPMGR